MLSVECAFPTFRCCVFTLIFWEISLLSFSSSFALLKVYTRLSHCDHNFSFFIESFFFSFFHTYQVYSSLFLISTSPMTPILLHWPSFHCMGRHIFDSSTPILLSLSLLSLYCRHLIFQHHITSFFLTTCLQLTVMSVQESAFPTSPLLAIAKS